MPSVQPQRTMKQKKSMFAALQQNIRRTLIVIKYFSRKSNVIVCLHWVVVNWVYCGLMQNYLYQLTYAMWSMKCEICVPTLRLVYAFCKVNPVLLLHVDDNTKGRGESFEARNPTKISWKWLCGPIYGAATIWFVSTSIAKTWILRRVFMRCLLDTYRFQQTFSHSKST